MERVVTEFWTIYTPAKWVGRLNNIEQLMQESEMVVNESTISSRINRIRQQLRVLDQKSDCIETVDGMGSRWNSHP